LFERRRDARPAGSALGGRARPEAGNIGLHYTKAGAVSRKGYGCLRSPALDLGLRTSDLVYNGASAPGEPVSRRGRSPGWRREYASAASPLSGTAVAVAGL